MTDEVCGNHDEEKSGCYGEHRKEIGVETDEGAHCEKGEGMNGVAPGEKTNKACLKDEDDTNAAANIRPTVSVRSYEDTSAYRELKRRKLLVINGILNPGRPMYFEDLLSGGRSKTSSIFSVGMTCCRSLRRRLVRHLCSIGRIGMAHLVRRRSCSEKPVSLLLAAPSCSFSFNLELEIDSRSLLRLLSGSGDGDPVVPGKANTGTGSSLLTKASAVLSSIWNRGCLRIL